MSATTNITTTLRPDDAIAQGSASFDATQRQYIDTQIRGCQTHLADSLINGTHATFVKVASGSATLAKGDVVCLASSALGYATVTLADAAAMAVAGVALGVVLLAAAPGTYAMVGINGLVGPSVTGLAATAGYVRVSSAGRAERVVSFSDGDYPLGAVDSTGYLTLARAAVVESGGGGGSISAVEGSGALSFTGTTTRTGAIAAASDTVPGTMSAANFSKLGGLPSTAIASLSVTAPVTSTGGSTPNIGVNAGQTATADYLVRRDASGNIEQRLDAVGVSATTAGVLVHNETTATGGAPQWSPPVWLGGREASGGDQAIRMGFQTRNAGDTSVVKLSILSKIGAGSATEIATIDGAGALGAVSATASSFVSAPDHYAENIYGLDGSSLVIAAGPAETIELRINSTVVATVNDDLFDLAFPVRLPASAPTAARHLVAYDDGPRWLESTGVWRAARRWSPQSLDDVTITAYDGLVASIETPTTTGVDLPAVAAGDGCAVAVSNTSGGILTITPLGGDTIMWVGGAGSLANNAAAIYIYSPGNWLRVPCS